MKNYGNSFCYKSFYTKLSSLRETDFKILYIDITQIFMFSSFPLGHGLPDLMPQRFTHGRRHGIPDLTVFVQS